jgi:hypothetical protein
MSGRAAHCDLLIVIIVHNIEGHTCLAAAHTGVIDIDVVIVCVVESAEAETSCTKVRQTNTTSDRNVVPDRLGPA